MAITKLPSGTYQARLAGSDGRILTETFESRLDAEEQVLKWKREKKEGRLKSTKARALTLDEYFVLWFQSVTATSANTGWRKNQLQLYRHFVSPLLGRRVPGEVRPASIEQVMVNMAKLGKSEQTRVHVFNLLRKMYGDAIETHELVSFNPVLRKFKPKVVVKEARHLNVSEATRLLIHVVGKKYGTAIWLQLYLGLRLGEVQGLRWEDIDLSTGRLRVRRVYVRKTESFRDYPKGGKQRTHTLPPELREHLLASQLIATSPLVVTSPLGNVLPYRWYSNSLHHYCRTLGIPQIGTHGLRHSTSELYLSHGATKDDVRELLGHASAKTTERYMHGRSNKLEEVSNVLQLFGSTTKNRPRSQFRFEEA